jgi:hypothetical protein
MSEASQLSPELARGILQVARALLVAARNWTLYPPDHPAVGTTVDRLCDALRHSSLGAAFAIGITPHTLLIDGTAADGEESAIAKRRRCFTTATWCTHLLGDISRMASARCCVCWLSTPTNPPPWRSVDLGDRWPVTDPRAARLRRLLARREGEVFEPANRDDLWR